MESSHTSLGYFPQMPVCNKHLSTELNSDFTLPDYQSEIKRLLCTKAFLSCPNEYIGNSATELEGTVSYRIIYLGADGKLYCATLEDKFSFSVPLEFTSAHVNTDDVTLVPYCAVEHASTKVLGPRKLNVRARLTCKALGLSPALHSTSIIGAPATVSIEKMTSAVTCAIIKRAKSEPLSLSDFIPLDPQIDNVRIIDAHCNAQFSESVHSADAIEARGEVLLKLLYCNDAQSALPISTVRKLPFSVNIPTDGFDSTSDCALTGYVEDLRLDVADNGISIEMLMIACAELQGFEDITYAIDAYSTEYDCEGKSESICVLEPIACKNASLTQNEVFKLEEIRLSKDAKIVDVFAKVTLNERTVENGRIFLSGKTDYQLIYHLDGEYSAISLSAPLRYALKIDENTLDDDTINWYVNAETVSLRTRCDSEKLYIDSELKFNYILQREKTVELLSELKLFEKAKAVDGDIVLCYPQNNTPIWEVAKKYKKKVSDLRSTNSLAETDTHVRNKFLVI